MVGDVVGEPREASRFAGLPAPVQHLGALLFLAADPLWSDPLRGNERWEVLLGRVGQVR
jgi:hypothetical protein